MNLNYNYWYFQNAFSPEQCDRIIKMGMQEDFELGDINRNKVEKVKEEDHVLKVMGGASMDTAISEILIDMMRKANLDSWKVNSTIRTIF